MAKKAEETSLANANPTDVSLRPSFMQEDVGVGLDTLKEFVKPPMIKVVQKQAKEPLSTMFDPGDVILSPVNVEVSGMIADASGNPTKDGVPFHVIPLLFFVNYISWNPIEMRGQLDAVRKQTLDPKDIIAVKARDPELRVEKCPENPKYSIKHCEHLNFLVMFFDGPHAGEMAVMSFARAEHKSGRNWATLIKMGKAPIFGRVYAAQTHFRTNAQGEWFGIDISNPSPTSGVGAWITDENQYHALKELHLKLKEAHENNLIVVDHDEEDTLDATATGDGEY